MDTLEMTEERLEKLYLLRRALKEGEDSGPAEYSLSALLRELDEEE